MKIVVTEPLYMAEEVERARPLGPVVYGPFDEKRWPPSSRIATCWWCGWAPYRRADHGRAPNLRFIVTATTGLDHIDLDAATRRRRSHRVLRDCPQAITDVSATAEHCLGLLLGSCAGPCRPPRMCWTEAGTATFSSAQLRGKRLGIVGHGRIGALLADYGAALGMEVVALTATKEDRGASQKLPLAELLRSSDVISIHVTADPENRHLIDRAAIATHEAGRLPLNTARGSLADERLWPMRF